MTKEESKLEIFKEKYEQLRKKYSLPKFEDINKDFHIDHSADVETDLIIIEVRKHVADKMAGYLRFAETLLNPTNAPMFIFSIIKTLSEEDKKELTDVYKKLAKNELKLIEIDVDFVESKEAEFIKESYNLWQGIKKKILIILKSVDDKWDSKFENNNKGYFG